MGSLDFCRFCLASESCYLSDIFDTKLNLPDKIYEALSIKITENDNLPNKICEFCICNLSYIQNYKKTTLKAKKQFNSYLEATHNNDDLHHKKPSSPAGGKIQYSMTNHFKKLEQHANKNLVHFSQSFNIKGEFNFLAETDSIKIEPDADWNFETTCVKVEPNDFLVTECNATKSEPEEQIEVAALSILEPKKKKSIAKRIKVDPELKGERPSLKSKKKKKKRGESKPGNSKEENKNVCELCGKAYSASAMKFHMNSHNGVFPFKCKMEGCDRAFKSPGNLKEHAEVHDHSRKFICGLCAKQFKRKRALKVHMTFHMDPSVLCKVCGKLLRRSDALKKHMMTHTGERPHKCLLCEKAFTDKYKLKVHMNVHTGARNYVCNICGMAYAHNCSLRAHTEKIHPTYPEHVF